MCEWLIIDPVMHIESSRTTWIIPQPMLLLQELNRKSTKVHIIPPVAVVDASAFLIVFVIVVTLKSDLWPCAQNGRTTNNTPKSISKCILGNTFCDLDHRTNDLQTEWVYGCMVPQYEIIICITFDWWVTAFARLLSHHWLRFICTYYWSTVTSFDPIPSIRQCLSYDACLEVKTEDSQNCSVLYCVTQLCTIICTPIWAVLTGERFYVYVLCFCVLLGPVYLY